MTSTWLDKLNPFSEANGTDESSDDAKIENGTKFQDLDGEDINEEEDMEDNDRELGGAEGQTMICGLPKRLFLLVLLLSIDIFVVNLLFSLLSPFYPITARQREVPGTTNQKNTPLTSK